MTIMQIQLKHMDKETKNQYPTENLCLTLLKAKRDIREGVSSDPVGLGTYNRRLQKIPCN